MFIRANGDTKPNYLVEGLAITIMAVCLCINLFGDQFGMTSFDPRKSDEFGGFKMVNVKHHHTSDIASN